MKYKIFFSWELFNFSRVEPSKFLSSGVAQERHSSICTPFTYSPCILVLGLTSVLHEVCVPTLKHPDSISPGNKSLSSSKEVEGEVIW